MFIFFSTLCKLCTRRTKEAEFLLQGDRRGDVVSVSANQRPVSGQWTNKPIRGRACPLPLTSVWSDSWCHYHPPGLRRGHRTALDTGKLQVTLTSGTKGEYFYPTSLSLPCLRRQMFCQQQEYCYKHFKPSVKICEGTEKLYPRFSNQAGLHIFYSLFTQIICFSLFPPSFYDSNTFSRYTLTNLNHTTWDFHRHVLMTSFSVSRI